MEDTVKLKWYFRLFSKLDNEACNVDMTNRAVAWGIDWIAGSLITAFPTVIFYMALTKTQEVNQNLLAFDQPYGWVAGILSLLFCIAYYVIYPYRHNGQTCGTANFRLYNSGRLSDSRGQLRLSAVIIGSGI